MRPFNILIITQEDPFYIRLFFEEFLKNFKPLKEIKGVVIAPTMGKNSVIKLIKQMYEFYGFWDFTKVGFRFLYFRFLGKVSKAISLDRFYSIDQVCRFYKVPVQITKNVNSEEFLEEIKKMDLDLIISVAAPQIFKEKLIKIPKKGCINIHNSKLPKYRGMLPNFWQMFHGEKSVGTTIHRINDGIDDGDILFQIETLILPDESLESVICKTKKIGAGLMIEAIN